MLERAVTTLEHFPSIAQLENIAVELGISSRTGWKYLEVADCLCCGGPGWHYVKTPKGSEAVVACDDCRAGKNLQQAPQGAIKHTLKSSEPGTQYSRPGREAHEKPMHPEMKKMLERRLATADQQRLEGGFNTKSLIAEMPMEKLDWKAERKSEP
jgi:hypothetical protein